VKVKINGVLVGTTPFHADDPGGYFHKPHLVFSARLDHSMALRISKDGYSTNQIALTEGPLEWIAVTGKRHGNRRALQRVRLAGGPHMFIAKVRDNPAL
jgi:hypothetical protein